MGNIMRWFAWVLLLGLALAASSGGWVDDGSGLSRSVGNTVIVDEIPYTGDTKVNAQYSDGVDAGTHYWEVAVSAAKMSLGLTSAHSFGPKYKIRGYFYNGNLSNGSGGLRVGFGPSLLPGDRVGMLVEFSDTMKVWFFVNDEPLGLAFDVPLPPSPVHPTVSFKSGSSAATIGRKTPPEIREPTDLPTGIPGKWIGMFENFGVNLGLEETGAGYRGYAKLLNTVQFNMVRQEDESYKVAMGPMTRMAGPEEMMAAERGLLLFLEGVTGLSLDGAEMLLVSSSMMDLVFSRDFSRHRPVHDLLILE